jgi:hypothetical protein
LGAIFEEGQRVKVKMQIKAVPNWQERLREFIDELIKDIDKQ